MKRKIKLMTLCLIVVLFAITLGGCSTPLSGKYINQFDPESYIEFYNKNMVTVYEDEENFPLGLTGTYKVRGKKLFLEFELGGFESEMEMSINKNKEIITYKLTNYVKEQGSGSIHIPWWGWLLIAGLAYTVIGAIYKGITKRDLDDDLDAFGDDLDNLSDKIDEHFDKLEDRIEKKLDSLDEDNSD